VVIPQLHIEVGFDPSNHFAFTLRALKKVKSCEDPGFGLHGRACDSVTCAGFGLWVLKKSSEEIYSRVRLAQVFLGDANVKVPFHTFSVFATLVSRHLYIYIHIHARNHENGFESCHSPPWTLCRMMCPCCLTPPDSRVY